MSYEQVEDLVRAWRKEGMDERDITFNQSMPDENLTIQGEICYTPWAPASSPWAPTGYSVLYTTIKEPMNLALAKEQKVIDGLSAEHLLRRNLDAQSMLDLERLLTQFPNSAIEFSSYSCAVGDLDRNTIFWEVRNY